MLDWSMLSVGDPAVDLMVAWTVLDAGGRVVFREAVMATDDGGSGKGMVDEAMWRKGRALALSVGVVAYAYYRNTMPGMAERG